MITTQTTEPTFASMHEVVMQKDELLQHLINNKAKHDVVLATAIAGYWDTAQTKIDERKKKFYAQLEEFTADAEREFGRVTQKIANKEELPNRIQLQVMNIDTSLGLVYPEDHSNDYERAIRMMQSSVFDKVKLSVDEYDAYVLNNWEWKKNFLLSNSFYVDTMLKKSGAVGPIGLTGNAGPAGSYAGYDVAARNAMTSIVASGCRAF